MEKYQGQFLMRLAGGTGGAAVSPKNCPWHRFPWIRCRHHIPSTSRLVPGRRLAHRRTGPCLRMHCPPSLSVTPVVACNSRKRWVRIGSARGLKPVPVDSPRRGQSAGRQDVQIVPDTFFPAFNPQPALRNSAAHARGSRD
jgi:hypothetical protein